MAVYLVTYYVEYAGTDPVALVQGTLDAVKGWVENYVEATDEMERANWHSVVVYTTGADGYLIEVAYYQMSGMEWVDTG